MQFDRLCQSVLVRLGGPVGLTNAGQVLELMASGGAPRKVPAVLALSVQLVNPDNRLPRVFAPEQLLNGPGEFGLGSYSIAPAIDTSEKEFYHEPDMKKYTHDQAFEIVESGYDKLTERYTRERERFDNWREVKAFSSRLPENGKVLDAGSGTGIPIAAYMVRSGFEVVGIDLSSAMVSTARNNVPGATFQQMNMAAIDLPPDSFDGLISCYAIIHVPREKHAAIFQSFHTVLKPQGVMLVSVASWAWEEIADYLGVGMYWSHYDPRKTESLITMAGFDIEFGRSVESGGEKHHWVLAHKR